MQGILKIYKNTQVHTGNIRFHLPSTNEALSTFCALFHWTPAPPTPNNPLRLGVTEAETKLREVNIGPSPTEVWIPSQTSPSQSELPKVAPAQRII